MGFFWHGRVRWFTYSRALVSAVSEALSAVLSQDDVVKVVFDFLQTSFASSKMVIMWQQGGSGSLAPIAQQGARNFKAVLEQNNTLHRILRQEKQTLTSAVLRKQATHQASPQIQKDNQAAEKTMHWLDVEMVTPLMMHGELAGVILLGKKSAGGHYARRERQLANALAPIIAVALHNARLYQQAVEIGDRLHDEMRRATEELQAANQQLKNLDKAKSEFLSIASHQLYTPLTALRGYLSMLKEGEYGSVTSKQQDIINIIDQSARRLLKFTESLLDISRIESGRFELHTESVNLVDIAQELVQDLLPLAKSKHLTMEFHEPKKSVPLVVVDRERIRQVMLNFVDNAIKYTQQGRVDIALHEKDAQVVFAVTDTGKGLHQQEVARLFNKFTRVGGAARFNTEGRGLGLYVARQIVKEHRGEVHVDSPGEGKGSTFAMSLPAEGAPTSLKVGEKAEVEIKAAEAKAR